MQIIHPGSGLVVMLVINLWHKENQRRRTESICRVVAAQAEQLTLGDPAANRDQDSVLTGQYMVHLMDTTPHGICKGRGRILILVHFPGLRRGTLQAEAPARVLKTD